MIVTGSQLGTSKKIGTNETVKLILDLPPLTGLPASYLWTYGPLLGA